MKKLSNTEAELNKGVRVFSDPDFLHEDIILTCMQNICILIWENKAQGKPVF